jgi:asparagine synthase (glutamine-hydrolysing)
MSMAHALEVRVPLIDHKLVEFLFTLSGNIKVNQTVPKPLLTKALGDAIPTQCVFRPKQGFELPFEIWLRESLEEEMAEKFLNTREEGVWPLDKNSVSRIWKEFQQGKLSWSRVWGIFVLGHWLKQNHIS